MADEKVKDFIVINFCECFKSTREALYSELGKEKNLRKGAESFYNSLKTPDEVEKYVELVEKTPEAKLWYSQVLLTAVSAFIILRFWFFLIQITTD